jgi:hypothetical protein
MIRIRIILGKNGLADRINITMFTINASLFLFQVMSLCVWYWKFYWYTTNFYGHNCNAYNDPSPPPSWNIQQCGGLVTTPTQCNECRSIVRTIAVEWWLGSNIASFISQVALVIILLQLGRGVKVPRPTILESKKVARNDEEPEQVDESDESHEHSS